MMAGTEILKGKRVLVVDDEPDILESLIELLEGCTVDTATGFELASCLIEKNRYDFAIFDIMGVNGFELLRLATRKDLPSLVLTGHALSPQNFFRSIKEGAYIYLPKEMMADIVEYLVELIEPNRTGNRARGRWLFKLKPYFDSKFGADWTEEDFGFWYEFRKQFNGGRHVERQMD